MKENDNPGGVSPEEPENQDPLLQWVNQYVQSFPGPFPQGFWDKELLEESPTLWFKKHIPIWDDERIALEVERLQLITKVSEIDERKHNKTINRREYQQFSAQYREWREDLDRRLAEYEQRHTG